MKRKRNKNKSGPIIAMGLMAITACLFIILILALVGIIKPMKPSICLLGDSTMAGQYVTSMLQDRQPDMKIDNKAEPGTGIKQIPIVKGYSVVYVLSGINNIYNNGKPSSIMTEMRKVNTQLKKYNKHVVFICPLPNKGHKRWTKDIQAKLIELNLSMQADKSLDVRNFNDYFGGLGLTPDLDAGDHLHLSEAGQNALGFLLGLSVTVQ